MDKRKLAVAVLGFLAIELENKPKKTRKQRVWCKEWSKKQDALPNTSLVRELAENNPDDYRNYLRMSEHCFQELLRYVSPMITKQDTIMRIAITAEQRLNATLRYMATGRTLSELKFSTGISAQALGHIIPETCRAIIQVLQQEYMKFPQDPKEWQKVAQQFQEYWKFPNCGGAIDGRHVRIFPPPNSGSYYYNYKGFFSIVLLAIVNAKYEFMYVNIGQNGRNSDGSVIEKTDFYTKLRNGGLKLPGNKDTVEGLNFVFVADDTFALGDHMLKPYSSQNLSREQKTYNYRLSQARHVVENAFDILANRFRIFHTAINLDRYKIDLLVYCCCVLHNFLLRTSESYMCQDDETNLSGDVSTPECRHGTDGLVELAPQQAQQTTASARQNRENYLHYFNGVGAVEQQNDLI